MPLYYGLHIPESQREIRRIPPCGGSSSAHRTTACYSSRFPWPLPATLHLKLPTRRDPKCQGGGSGSCSGKLSKKGGGIMPALFSTCPSLLSILFLDAPKELVYV
mmetsp:Transcript_12205/g.24326  ORF Transcript_12205/g.24326 Transcript_12205/m.24326 type:complete len:105 (-) Transcript_12205:1212-1526(-)